MHNNRHPTWRRQESDRQRQGLQGSAAEHACPTLCARTRATAGSCALQRWQGAPSWGRARAAAPRRRACPRCRPPPPPAPPQKSPQTPGTPPRAAGTASQCGHRSGGRAIGQSRVCQPYPCTPRRRGAAAAPRQSDAPYSACRRLAQTQSPISPHSFTPRRVGSTDPARPGT